MTTLMRPESLSQLAGTGNLATVEEEWMRLLETPGRQPRQMAEYAPVLAELCKRGKQGQAEALAWAAIEGLMGKHSAEEVLPLAGQLLLHVGESEELRKQVSELYRTVHGHREGFEELLKEAGLPSGRPVRRALRTLDVCLTSEEGGYLVAREGGGAGRIDSIDRTNWKYTISTPEGQEILGAVHLADQYFPAAAGHFDVMRGFEPQGLKKQLDADPAPRIIEICKRHGGSVDTETLAELLAPVVGDWKKWWTKARADLKKCANLRVEGRAPYTITYEDRAVNYESEVLAEFNRHRDPVTRYQIIEKYVRECPARAVQPDKELLVKCHEVLRKQAQEVIAAREPRAGLIAAMAGRLGEFAGVERADAELHALFKPARDVALYFRPLKDDDLLELAVKALAEARPEGWRAELLDLLPTLPHTYCDRAVEWLVEGGCARQDFEPVVQKVIASPAAHFGALLWLWDGPAYSELAAALSPVTLLSRILRALADSRRVDAISKDQEKEMAQTGRSVLAARGYAQLDKCLEGIDPGMAIALRTQMNQVENLGRTVTNQMLRKIGAKIPPREAAPAVMPWAREDVVYTTEAGMARKQEEIDHHVNVKMKENAKAIGRAAEKGDLSENSEYKFALEERDLLRARLAQMNAELQNARVLSVNDVPTDHIGIGTRVVFKRVTDGEPYEMTFVGPWDADHDRGLYNYKAPLAQQILGMKVGDRVDFTHSAATGTYEVAELHNGIVDLDLPVKVNREPTPDYSADVG